MKINRPIYILIVFIGLMILPLILLAESIMFGANESPPYWSENIDGNGMSGEILHAMSLEAGLISKIEFLPLKRLINNNTNNDLGNPLFYIKNQNFFSIIPIAIYKINFIYYEPNHNEKIIIDTLSDLKKYKTGVLKGTLIDPDYFKQAGITFETSYSQDSLIKKLKLGRIDLSLEIDLVAKSSIIKLFPNEIEKFSFIEIKNSDSPIAIMISENYPNAERVSNKLKKGLSAIIKNGTYLKIIEKYYGKGNVPNNWFISLNRFTNLYNFKTQVND